MITLLRYRISIWRQVLASEGALAITFLDVVVRQSPSILELLSGKDETLLIWRDAFFVLDLGLHILDRVGGLDLEGDGLARESLDEDLHFQKRQTISSKRRHGEKERIRKRA